MVIAKCWYPRCVDNRICSGQDVCGQYMQLLISSPSVYLSQVDGFVMVRYLDGLIVTCRKRLISYFSSKIFALKIPFMFASCDFIRGLVINRKINKGFSVKRLLSATWWERTPTIDRFPMKIEGFVSAWQFENSLQWLNYSFDSPRNMTRKWRQMKSTAS